jgi:hypothetical protein
MAHDQAKANVVGKRLAKEEGYSSGDSSGKEAIKVTPARGEENLELGDDNPDSSNCNPSKENDRQGEESVSMDVNMVFTIPTQFCAPTEVITELPWVRNMPCSRSQKIRMRT